ncbi:MAG: hypothetical protein ABI772_08385 [Bacteroidota bacterium]
MKPAFVLYIFCLLFSEAHAQTPAPADSAIIYRNIEDYAKRHKFTKWVHRLFFRPLPSIASKVVRKEQRKAVTDPYYRKLEKKIIRNIEITTLDPFGYVLKDTSVVPHSFLKRTGNAFHNKTAVNRIRHLLLFEEGERFDSLRVRDSERLIRSQRYIRDVIFTCKKVAKGDSVDIYIRAMDVWSLIVEGSGNTSRFSPDVTERNFLGLGHRLEVEYNNYYDDGTDDIAVNYGITNINKSFANAGFYFFRNSTHGKTYSVNLDRPFYSTFAKWAGGVYLSQHESNVVVVAKDSTLSDNKQRSFQQDYWIGHSWKLFKGQSAENRTTNLILSFRYANLFNTTPGDLVDTSNVYANDRFYLTGIGISQRKYISDKYVLKFGDGEDVPSGKAYGIVTGYRVRAGATDWYLGMRLSAGNYYNWGYFSYSLEYGTYTNLKQFNQGVVLLEANYFTGLAEAGGWKFRQFIKPSLTLGINRLPTEKITINNESGIKGFSSDELTGVKRIMVRIQTQSYAPWKVIGFRFGPFLVFNAGMLSDADENLLHSKVYSQIGVGLLIKNEYLVLNSFQISIAFYPLIPGSGADVFKFNSVRTTDYSIRDFDFSLPTITSFQ